MRYEKPQTVAEAARLLSAEKGVARILAGGTDMLVQMKSGMVEPDLLVDIKALPGTRTIVKEAGGFRIGAGVSGAQLSEDADLKAAWPGVVEAANLIGSTQVQGRCTMVGNLCNASPAADSVPALVAAGAKVRVAGRGAGRDVAVEEIPAGPGKTKLKKGEFITSVFLPARGARCADAYLRFIPRTEMDIAVASAAVNLSLDEKGVIKDARVALGAVAPTVVLCEPAAKAIIGTRLDDAALEKLAAACSAAAKPIDDKRGSVEYRKDVVGVLAKRAARIAYTRAGGQK
ncbi:FAD binding domain-containing protein [Solirhodobacter olei]|uniref:FAD binding domain-containing protein n=1 Tax=Solirhodobacter olei TaxID=2493082 RepID=UPI000FD7FF80|nr:xanthine dehydrogenase family protein subunit M [Solirhodobacter olei]